MQLSLSLESWDTLVVMLSNSVPNGQVSMDTVSHSLLNEESKKMVEGGFGFL